MPPPIALFDGKGGAMNKFLELERRVHQMHADGQNPMGIQSWIQQQLLPMANMTKTELQGEVNRAQQAVDNCATQLAAAEDGAREQETTLSIGESRHNECELEMAQKTKRASDDCTGVQSLIDTLEAPPSVADIDLNSTDAVEDALQANYRFFEEEYPKYMDEDAHCASATSLAEQQSQQCEADKSNLEASYCSLRSARGQICSDYDACFVEKTALFDRIISDVRQVEAHTKSSFQTLTCFGRTVMMDMDNARPTCNASAVDTTYLDVFYPSQPNKESCSNEVSTSWNYTDSLCEGGAGDDQLGGQTDEAEDTSNTTGNTSLFVVNDEKAGHEKHDLVDGKKDDVNSTSGNQSANSESNPHR